MRRLVFEGLPGGGKSTLSRLVSKELEVDMYSEHVLSEELLGLLTSINVNDDYLYQKNWLIKDDISQYMGRDSIFDRCHITTLSYNFAKSIIQGRPHFFEDSLYWYKNAIAEGKLLEPEMYIILDISPDLCNTRKSRKESSDVWGNVASLEASQMFYNSLEDYLEKKTPIIRLNAEEPFDVVKNKVLELAHELFQ